MLIRLDPIPEILAPILFSILQIAEDKVRRQRYKFWFFLLPKQQPLQYWLFLLQKLLQAE
jgi:hypothetical protein